MKKKEKSESFMHEQKELDEEPDGFLLLLSSFFFTEGGIEGE